MSKVKVAAGRAVSDTLEEDLFQALLPASSGSLAHDSVAPLFTWCSPVDVSMFKSPAPISTPVILDSEPNLLQYDLNYLCQQRLYFQIRGAFRAARS